MAQVAPALGVARPEPARAPLERGRLTFALVGLLLGMLVSTLDQTIVSTALPTIVRELGGLAGVAEGLGGNGALAFRDPRLLRELPPSVQGQSLHAFASSLDTVFLIAVPVVLAGFVVAWFLPEMPRRAAIGAAGVPAVRDVAGPSSPD